MADLWLLRGMDPRADLAFVRNAWLCSYAKRAVVRDAQGPPRVAFKVYEQEHSDVVNDILSRASVIVACAVDDLEQLLGFCCYELQDRPTIHYVYVKEPFRQLGMAREMVRHALSQMPRQNAQDVWVTHWTHKCSFLFKGNALDIYNPYRREHVRKD